MMKRLTFDEDDAAVWYNKIKPVVLEAFHTIAGNDSSIDIEEFERFLGRDEHRNDPDFWHATDDEAAVDAAVASSAARDPILARSPAAIGGGAKRATFCGCTSDSNTGSVCVAASSSSADASASPSPTRTPLRRRDIDTPELLSRIQKNVVWSDQENARRRVAHPERAGERMDLELHSPSDHLQSPSHRGKSSAGDLVPAGWRDRVSARIHSVRAATPRALFSSERLRRLHATATRAVQIASMSPPSHEPSQEDHAGRSSLRPAQEQGGALSTLSRQLAAEYAVAAAGEAEESSRRRRAASEELKRGEAVRRMRLAEREKREAARGRAQQQEEEVRESRRHTLAAGQTIAVGYDSATVVPNALSSPQLPPIAHEGRRRGRNSAVGNVGRAVPLQALLRKAQSDPGLMGPLHRRREKNYEWVGGSKVDGFPRASRTGEIIRKRA